MQINRESYKLLVQSVEDCAIFMMDVDGNIMSWNKGAEHIKGYTANEVIGRHISLFYTQFQSMVSFTKFPIEALYNLNCLRIMSSNKYVI